MIKVLGRTRRGQERSASGTTLKDLRGKELSLSNLRGKVVLLYFWATWCGPCREEMARLEKLHRELRTRELVVLGITNEAPGVVRDFLDKNNYTFPILVDTSRKVWQQYQVEIIPVTIVVDRSGKIVSYDVGVRGEGELRATLEKAGLGAKGRANRVRRF